MPDLDNLDLQNDEIIGEINWDAPEKGTFSPRLEAGKAYDFIFALEDESWGEREQDGKMIRSVKYKATTTYTAESGEEREITIRYQSADFFKSPKMAEKRMNSEGEELMRSLNLRVDGPLTWEKVKQAFKEADGRAHFTAVVGWNAYSKEDKINIRTHPRYWSKSDLPWPKGADGKFEAVVTFPGGERATGREEIVGVKLPKKN